jgi:putative tricarboxylic transport membrane protein
METSLMKSLAIFDGNAVGFFQRPISATLLLISAIIFVVSIYFGYKDKGISGDSEI